MENINIEEEKLILKENSNVSKFSNILNNSNTSEASNKSESKNKELINFKLAKTITIKDQNERTESNENLNDNIQQIKHVLRKYESKRSENSRESAPYNRIIEMMKSLNSNSNENSNKSKIETLSEKPDGVVNKAPPVHSIKNNTSGYHLSSFLKTPTDKHKNDQEMEMNLMSQLRNKLNDFQRDLEEKQQVELNDSLNSVKKKMEDEKKHQLVNLLPKKGRNDMFLKDRIFWSKEKMQKVREKFLSAKLRIEKKTEEDFNDMRKCIEDGDVEQVVGIMLNEHFKAFYKLEIKKQGILEHMIVNNQAEMLMKVLADEFYIFNFNFIFDLIGTKLQDREKGCIINEEELGMLFMNIIQYDLYNKSLVKLLAWFIGSFNFFDAFRLLVSKHSEFNEDKEFYNYFDSDGEIWEYINNDKNYNETLIACLENNMQNLAIALISYQQELKDNMIINFAVKYNSLSFLKFIWEQFASRETFNRNSYKRRGGFYKSQNQSVDRNRSMLHINFSLANDFNHGNLVFELSDLIMKFAKAIPSNSASIHEIVSTWRYIEKDEKLLATLFEVQCFDDISTVIFRQPGHWKFTKEQFSIIIEEGELDLILFYVKLRECRTILDEIENQKKIVHKYIKYGNKMYYGAEMLSYIRKNNWNMQLTNDLLKYTERTIKTKDILNCHSPVLTCLLLCEFLSFIAENSVQHRVHCEKVIEDLCNFSHSIQEANPEEKYVKFLMTQKDTKGRTAYQISADNDIYSVLKTAEIGTIVQKMWNGRLSHDGLISFSSVTKYIDISSGRTLNPFENFESFDQSKTYLHQLSLWTESSSLRYLPESISTIVLIMVYNFFIYFLVNRTTPEQEVKMLMQPILELEDDLRFMVSLYMFWTFCIVLNIPLQYLFGYLSGRKYKMDNWGYIEIFMFISSMCLLIDTVTIFPPTDENGNTVPSNGISDNAFILRALILSINDVFVWLRITGIFLTYKNLGPLIRMIYMLASKTLKYLLVYALYMAGSAAIFTAVFYNASDQFSSFSVTITNLFSSFLNNPNVFNFNEYQVFGAIAVILITTLSGLILSNLLIAVLSNEYEVLSDVVDASHRSVLIRYFRRYKWDRNFGYLIFLTTPLNIFNFFVLPFSLCFNKKKFNKYVCRVYFALFYLPAIVLMIFCLCLILSPLAYLKGIIMMISYQSTLKRNICLSLYGFFSWVLLGFPYILAMIARDFYHLLTSVYKKIDVASYEKNRIQKYISKDDIRIFLQFIHARENDEANDLHSLFLDFLNFDQDKKAENDSTFKEKSVYLKQLKTAAGLSLKKKGGRQHASIILYNNKSPHNNTSGSNLAEEFIPGSSIIKRNLIIIEILENFLIDDGSDNFIVDVTKMKMLLPKTMNINIGYIKRILNTDINSLTKAVNKLKTKKNKFMQNKLLNKIVGATIRLDHIVDNIDNLDPLHKEADRKKNKFDVDENEDDFYAELFNLLTKISGDIKKSIDNTKIKNDRKNAEKGNHDR